MPRLKAHNNISLELDSDLSDSSTTVTVNEELDLSTPFRATIHDNDFGAAEIVEVTDIEGYDWTVERGKEDSIIQNWPSGSSIEVLITAGLYNDLDYLEVDGGEWD